MVIESKANLKRLLKDGIDNGLRVSSRYYNAKGQLVVDNPPAPVVKVQSNAFAMMRNNKESWIRLDQRGETWAFTNNVVTVKNDSGSIFIFELHGTTFAPGDKVKYYQTGECGIIKSLQLHNSYAFVVYACNHDWDKYEDYTAQGCYLHQIVKVTDEEFNKAVGITPEQK